MLLLNCAISLTVCLTLTKLLTVVIDPNDLRSVLNFGIMSLVCALFEWHCCHYTSEFRATVILLLHLLTL